MLSIVKCPCPNQRYLDVVFVVDMRVDFTCVWSVHQCCVVCHLNQTMSFCIVSVKLGMRFQWTWKGLSFYCSVCCDQVHDPDFDKVVMCKHIMGLWRLESELRLSKRRRLSFGMDLDSKNMKTDFNNRMSMQGCSSSSCRPAPWRWPTASRSWYVSYMTPASILWRLWTERNQRCFDDISTARCQLKARCLVFLFSWVNHTPVYNPDLFLEFISSIILWLFLSTLWADTCPIL